MLLYLFGFRKVFFKGAFKSSTAFFTVYHAGGNTAGSPAKRKLSWRKYPEEIPACRRVFCH
jgi:hypothetical protein